MKILALFGESSSGKDSIQNWLVNKYPTNMNRIISYTSRPKRDYEMNNREYHFISKNRFINMIYDQKILEYTKFNDWYYGTAKESLSIDKINIGVFNPNGIKSLLKNNKIDILPVWIKADDKRRLIRSIKREANPNCEEICRRFLADKKDFLNIDFKYEIFINDDNNNEEYYGFLNRPMVKSFIGQN